MYIYRACVCISLEDVCVYTSYIHTHPLHLYTHTSYIHTHPILHTHPVAPRGGSPSSHTCIFTHTGAPFGAPSGGLPKWTYTQCNVLKYIYVTVTCRSRLKVLQHIYLTVIYMYVNSASGESTHCCFENFV